MTSYADEQIADAERRKAYQECRWVDMRPLPDSGRRAEFESGMVRDVEDDKVKYDLVLDGPMFERWAAHMTAGAEKYDERNWMLAEGNAEFQRFRRSALRHFIQWFQGNDSEDHAAAVIFNINGAEYVTDRMVAQEDNLANLSHDGPSDWTAPVQGRPAIYDGGF